MSHRVFIEVLCVGAILLVVSLAGSARAQNAGCCVGGGACLLTTQVSCTSGGGSWLAGASCSPNPCAGACCKIDGSCVMSTQAGCVSGTWVQGGLCSNNLISPYCPAPRACCTAGVCQVISPFFCGGIHGTASTPTCAADACLLGRCCRGVGACAVQTRIACGDFTWTAGGTCGGSACANPLMGACCNGPTCTITLPPPFCASGMWTAWKAVCAPDECFIATTQGTCCTISGTCTFSTQATCGGNWGVGLLCSQPPCASATGACCRGATCVVTMLTSCAGANMRFGGTGTSCNVPGNQASPCCYSDFDQSGALAVLDIFEFINAWFDGDPTARFASDGSPGLLSVQNIFDFLGAWLSGCG